MGSQLGKTAKLLNLPTDFSRHANNRHYGESYHVEISAELTQSLKQLAQQQGVTLYSVMMAAYQVLFHQITGQSEVWVDTSMINRTQSRFEKTLGQVSIIHTICTTMRDDESFSDLAKRVQQTVRDALKNQSYPSQLLAEPLQLSTAPVYNRAGQTLFNLVSSNFSQLSLERLGNYGLSLESTDLIPAGSSGTFHEINTQFTETAGKLVGNINYETDLYKRSTIQKLMENYQIILQQIVANPTQSIATLRNYL